MLNQRLLESVPNRAQDTALVFGARRISYASLWQDVGELSHGLVSSGVTPGTVVAVLSENMPELIILLLALARCGAIAVPLNTSFKPSELSACISASKASWFCFGSAYALTAGAVLRSLNEALRQVWLSAEPPAALGSDVLEHTASLAQGRAGPAAIPVPEQAGPYVCLFSSGTTGRAKRLLRTQANLLAEIDAYIERVNLIAADRTLCANPLYHSYALCTCLFPVLASGGQLVLPALPGEHGRGGDAPLAARLDQLIELIEREQITVFPSIPYLLEALVDHPRGRPESLKTLRCCLAAGNPSQPGLSERCAERFSVGTAHLYGCSEAGTIAIALGVFARQLAREQRARLILIGRSQPNERVRAALAELEQLGGEALYFAADVADRPALQRAARRACSVRRDSRRVARGRLDARCVHSAQDGRDLGGPGSKGRRHAPPRCAVAGRPARFLRDVFVAGRAARQPRPMRLRLRQCVPARLRAAS